MIQSYNEVTLLLKQQQLQEACDLLQNLVEDSLLIPRSITNDSKDITINALQKQLYKTYAHLQRNFGNYVEAAEVLIKAVEIDPGDSMLWKMLADCAHDLSNLALMRVCLEKCHELKPALYRSELELFLNQIGDVDSLQVLSMKKFGKFPPLPNLYHETYENELIAIPVTFQYMEHLNRILRQLSEIKSKNPTFANPLLLINLSDRAIPSQIKSTPLSQLSSSQQIRPRKSSSSLNDSLAEIIQQIQHSFDFDDIGLSLKSNLSSFDSSVKISMINLNSLFSDCNEIYFFDFLKRIFDFLFEEKVWLEEKLADTECSLLLDFLLMISDLQKYDSFICVMLFDKYLDELSNEHHEKSLFYKNLYMTYLCNCRGRDDIFEDFFQLANWFLSGMPQNFEMEKEFQFVNTLHLQKVSKMTLSEFDKISGLKKELSSQLINFITQKSSRFENIIPFEKLHSIGNLSYFVFYQKIFSIIQRSISSNVSKDETKFSLDLSIEDKYEIEESFCSFFESYCANFSDLNKYSVYFTGQIVDCYLIAFQPDVTLSRRVLFKIVSKLSGITMNCFSNTEFRLLFMNILSLLLQSKYGRWDESFYSLVHAFLSESHICHLDKGHLLGILMERMKEKTLDFFCCFYGVPLVSHVEDISALGKFHLDHQFSIYKYLLFNYPKLVQLNDGITVDNVKDAKKVVNYFQKFLQNQILLTREVKKDHSCLIKSLSIDCFIGDVKIQFFSHFRCQSFGFVGKLLKSVLSKKGHCAFEEFVKYFEYNVIFNDLKNTDAWNSLEKIYHQYAIAYSTQPPDIVSKHIKQIKTLFNMSIRCYFHVRNRNPSLALERILNFHILFHLCKNQAEFPISKFKQMLIKETLLLSLPHSKVSWKFSYLTAKSLSKSHPLKSLYFYIKSSKQLKSTSSPDRSCDPQYKILRKLYQLVLNDTLTVIEAIDIGKSENIFQITTNALDKTEFFQLLVDNLLLLKETVDKRKKLEHRSIFLASYICCHQFKDLSRAKNYIEMLVLVRKDKISFECWKTEMELFYKHYSYVLKYSLFLFEITLLLDASPYEKSISLIKVLELNSHQFLRSVKLTRECLKIAKAHLSSNDFIGIQKQFVKSNQEKIAE